MNEYTYSTVWISSVKNRLYRCRLCGNSLKLTVLFFGIILMQACLPVKGTKFHITAPAKEGREHIERARQYNMQEKYAQAEAEATQGIIKCKESLDRLFKNKSITAEDGFYRSIDECMALGYYYRGFALVKQGDLSCAELDLEWAADHAREADRFDIAAEADRLLRHVKEYVKKTGQKGRWDCPPIGIKRKDGRII